MAKLLLGLVFSLQSTVAGNHSSIERITEPHRNEINDSDAVPATLTNANQPFPKYFFKEYSRSQDGTFEDAKFHIRFVFHPSRNERGETCNELRLVVESEIRSTLRYYRDRLDNVDLYNVGEKLPGAEDQVPFLTPERRTAIRARQNAPVPPIKLKQSFIDYRKAFFFTPIYIAVGQENGRGEIKVGCLPSRAGNYSGDVDLKSFSDSDERLRIHWSINFQSIQFNRMNFTVSERAIPDSQDFMGRIHPRRKAPPGTPLENMALRLVGSGHYPNGNAPAGVYRTRFTEPGKEPPTDI